jgi:glycosyltransferase involved in cell wall biosynthesis
LREAIDHGRTGFLVDSVAEMAAAIQACRDIDPRTCRAVARERFDAHRMTGAYLDLYHRLARRQPIAIPA